jgi:hypothetical protein
MHLEQGFFMYNFNLWGLRKFGDVVVVSNPIHEREKKRGG